MGFEVYSDLACLSVLTFKGYNRTVWNPGRSSEEVTAEASRMDPAWRQNLKMVSATVERPGQTQEPVKKCGNSLYSEHLRQLSPSPRPVPVVAGFSSGVGTGIMSGS